MKRFLILTVLIFGLSSAKADNEKYIRTMQETLSLMDSAKSSLQFVDIANRFERIASAEEQEWLPLYYASLNYVIAAYFEEDKAKSDEFIDKAEILLAGAETISNNNVELAVLRANATNARLAVKPAARGRKLGPLFDEQIEAAKKLDSENPRIYLLKGESLFYTPAMWGGGKDKALPVLELAKEKFLAFKPLSDIHPNWGLKRCEDLIVLCKSK